MNVWFIGYVVCCVVDILIMVKLFEYDDRLTGDDLLYLVISVAVAPISLCCMSISWFKTVVIWERKK